MEKLNVKDKTYHNIPLSVIYTQFIRFKKENGIYALYLGISFPKTKMSYETFSKHIFILEQYTNRPIDSLFMQFFIVGPNYPKYGIYRNSIGVWGSACNFHVRLQNCISLRKNFLLRYLCKNVCFSKTFHN